MLPSEGKESEKTMADNETSKFSEFCNDVRQLAEEIRLKVHLAGMDAKDAWSKIEPKLSRFEKEVEKVSTEAEKELREVGAELKESLSKLRDRIQGND